MVIRYEPKTIAYWVRCRDCDWRREQTNRIGAETVADFHAETERHVVYLSDGGPMSDAEIIAREREHAHIDVRA